MDALASVAVLAVALVLVASACLKLASPLAIAPLLQAIGVGLPARYVAFAGAVAEILCAAVILVAPSWGLLLAAALLTAFTVALVLAVRSGSRPRCGCLGDFSVAATGPVHVARNVFLIAAIGAAFAGSGARPLAALPAAAALAFLVLIVPEAVEAVREFRAAVRQEASAIYEHGGKT